MLCRILCRTGCAELSYTVNDWESPIKYTFKHSISPCFYYLFSAFSNFAANKIHVSECTTKILWKHDVHDIVKRGDLEIKVMTFTYRNVHMAKMFCSIFEVNIEKYNVINHQSQNSPYFIICQLAFPNFSFDLLFFITL